YTLPLEGGTALNITPGMKSSATALEWSCHGGLVAELLTGDQAQIAEMGSGRATAAPHTLWSGAQSLSGFGRGSSTACFSGVLAVSHESFTSPPEIQVGAPGKAHDITSRNAHISMPVKPLSVTWKNDGFDEQG